MVNFGSRTQNPSATELPPGTLSPLPRSSCEQTISTEYQMMRIALILAATLGLSACETIKGAGQDLQGAGQTIETEAAQSQAEM